MKPDTNSKNTQQQINKESFENFLREHPDAILKYVNMGHILEEQRKLFEQILERQARSSEARETQMLNTLENLAKEIIQKFPRQEEQKPQQVVQDEGSARLSSAYSSFAQLNPAQAQNFSTDVKLNENYNRKLKEMREQQQRK